MAHTDEFEAFLEPGFGAVAFAASLLQATNVAEHAELDIHTALKKLRFDAAECDRRIDSLTAANHAPLLGNLFAVGSVQAQLQASLVPANKRLQASFRRIQHEVVQPYDQAVRLNGAFRRMHATLQLLRGSAFFALFVQQLNDLDDDDVVKAARLYVQVSSFYPEPIAAAGTPESSAAGTPESSAAGTPEPSAVGTPEPSAWADVLRPVRLVQLFRPQLSSRLAVFCSRLTAQISHDLGHHSSFHGANHVLQDHLAALRLVSPAAFVPLVDSAAISKSIQVSLTALTRALQSPRVLVSTLSDVASASASFVQTLAAVLSVPELAPDSDSRSLPGRSLLEVLEAELGADLEHLFYERLASKFKKALAVTLARGGPIARNLRAQADAISDAVAHMAPAAQAHFEDALSLVST